MSGFTIKKIPEDCIRDTCSLNSESGICECFALVRRIFEFPNPLKDAADVNDGLD